ncbi:hypothetical protein BC940DRAFT_302544 [Gongronella butleri]|nr:hypothetical protein BC940DRAFT_302544 [Gongronella butleri]
MLKDDDVYFDNNAFQSLLNSSTQQTFSSLSQYVDDDPWGSVTHFDSQPLTGGAPAAAVDDDILEQGVTPGSVLLGIDLPEIYDTAYIRASPQGDHLILSSLERVIHLSGLPPRTLDKIRSLVVPSNAEYATRAEFNTALALVACAQKNMELSLHTVYQHRNELPLPILPNLDTLKSTTPSMTNTSTVISDTTSSTTSPMTSPRPENPKQSAKDQLIDDPWRKPGATSHAANANGSTGAVPTISSSGAAEVANGHVPASPILGARLENTQQDMDAASSSPLAHRISLPTTQKLDTDDWFSDLDALKVTIAPEREGFLFKHVNYAISSHQRSSLVLRRYSDFYWLWEILIKTYPFRIIPIMPPKKVDLRGLTPAFLEIRRQGLAHFINFIVRHPVLKQDKLVDIFLCEPSEFLAWRRANAPDIQEEFVRVNEHIDHDDLAACIPKDLSDRLHALESRLPKLLQYYQNMHDTMVRVADLAHAQKAAMDAFRHTITDLGDLDKDCYVPGCQGCPHMTRGYDSFTTYLGYAGDITDQEANATLEGLAAQLKQHHDTLLAFKDMLDRRQKLSLNQIDALSKRLASNRARANQNRGVPGLENNVSRLDEAIQADQERLVFQQRRDLFIQYCMHCELTFLHKQQAFIATLYQTHVHEKLQFTRRSLDNWKALEVLMCNMPSLQEFS